MVELNFVKIFEDSFKKNWNFPALSDYEGATYTFEDLARDIERLHILFEACKLHPGDKVALIGKNNYRWCVAYLASITYGAVIVPILQDFNPNDVQHIVNHSQSSLFFCSEKIWESLEEEQISGVRAIFSLSDDLKLLSHKNKESFQSALANLDTLFAKKYPSGFSKEQVRYTEVSNKKVLVLNYTSGTTGFSKGVMITGNNLAGNMDFAHQIIRLGIEDRVLSFLPLAHTYGCAFEFLYSLSEGCHITLLGKTPSPKILLKAFGEIKPTIVFAVPLILEKIYKKTILPSLNKRSMRLALSIPFVSDRIYHQIQKKLMTAMGGCFSQFIVGGAPLNKEVEEFLRKIKFPVTVGYGMTECAPLISFSLFPHVKSGSCGKVLFNMEARIDSPDPFKIAGEIQVRGENVMQGYYRNEKATQEAFTKDGWLKTGDLGTIDEENYLYIRGRNKSMILGASGQNIYPEEIEAKLNNLPYIMESLVVEKGGKLIALVYPDYEAVDSTGISSSDLPLIMEQNKTTINNMVAGYEKIAEIQLYPTEFEKTPKKSIKRYLYTNM